MNFPLPTRPGSNAWLRHQASAAALIAVLAGSGCTTEPAAYHPADTTKYTLENTERFAAVDRFAHDAVACTGLQYRALADGRAEVIANLRNRAGRRVEIQASCAFRDAAGLAMPEETPWKTITIAENTTEAVRFTASSGGAKTYTVRIRQGR